MTNAQGEERRLVRWRRRTVVFLLVVAAVLVVRAIADMWLGGALNAEIARLEDRHGPLRWDSVRKIHPWKTWPRRMAPDNRARLIDAAAARITIATDEHENLLSRVNTQPETMTSGRVLEIADANREAVELAVRAARLPHSNWGIGCCGAVSNLLDVRFLSTVLAVTARADTDAGRADAAAANLMAGFAIATAMSSEPAPIMLLVAAREAYVHDVALKDLLNRGEPSAAMLTELARVIDEGLAAPPARAALLGLLKSARANLPRVERGWFFTSEQYGSTTDPSTWTRSIAWLARPVIRYRALQDLADTGRAVDAASMTRAERAGITSSLRPPGPGLVEVGDAWSVILGHAATAVALRRFRIDYGAYPARLNELVPGYLKAVPIDPFAGGPPEYVRSGNGFELRTPAVRQTRQLELSRNWNVTR